jgi:hypothetical protein
MNEFFSTSNRKSILRVGFIICVITANAVAVLAVLLNRDLYGAGALVGGLLLTAFGGKFGQKFAESERFNPTMYNRQTYFGEGNPFGEQP